jgi:hypothetical protein
MRTSGANISVIETAGGDEDKLGVEASSILISGFISITVRSEYRGFPRPNGEIWKIQGNKVQEA